MTKLAQNRTAGGPFQTSRFLFLSSSFHKAQSFPKFYIAVYSKLLAIALRWDILKSLKVSQRYYQNYNVGQCPTWWSPWRTQVAPSVQRRKVWLTPATRCHAVMLPRRETCWNLQGCLKLPDGSQPLVGRSSPYYEDMWRTYWCLTNFFRLSIRALIAKI